MDIKYVYLLWEHDEHGPENLVATLDRSKLVNLLDTFKWANHTATQTLVHTDLEVLLLRTDEDLSSNNGIHEIESGWGGIHLQVTVLQ